MNVSKAKIPNVFNYDDEVMRLAGELTPVIVETVGAAGKKKMAELGFGGTFNLFDPRVAEFLEERPLKLAGEVCDTTNKAIRKTLAEGVKAGEGVPALRDRIRKTFDEASISRAENIAWTETHTATQTAYFEAMNQSGMVKGKRWNAGADAKTRPSHRKADGQIRALNKPFTVGRARLMYPGDPRGPAEEICRCRCSFEEILQEGTRAPSPEGAPTKPKLPRQKPTTIGTVLTDVDKQVVNEGIQTFAESYRKNPTKLWNKPTYNRFKHRLDEALDKLPISPLSGQTPSQINRRLQAYWQGTSSGPEALVMKDLSRKKTIYDLRIGYGDDKKSILTKIDTAQKKATKIFCDYAGVTRKELSRILAANREFTQQALKIIEPGSKTFTVYRGVPTEYIKNQGATIKTGQIRVQTNSLSSWSTSKKTAQEFAGPDGYILETQAPLNRVFSSGLSMEDFRLWEREFILDGGFWDVMASTG